MKLDIVRSRNETGDLLRSITINSETFFEQTHTGPQEILENEITKPRKTFSFKPPIPVEGSWMLGLTKLEVSNLILI